MFGSEAASEVEMRQPCKCGWTTGRIETRSGQDCVFCKACDQWCYNAPRTETGRAVRTMQTTHEAIKPRQRARILLRDNGQCVIDGRKGTVDHPLHVSHVISVADGHDMQMSDSQINSDENLVTLCEECNNGIGAETFPARLYLALIIRARTRNQ